jgi:hypothetical protein
MSLRTYWRDVRMDTRREDPLLSETIFTAHGTALEWAVSRLAHYNAGQRLSRLKVNTGTIAHLERWESDKELRARVLKWMVERAKRIRDHWQTDLLTHMPSHLLNELQTMVDLVAVSPMKVQSTVGEILQLASNSVIERINRYWRSTPRQERK